MASTSALGPGCTAVAGLLAANSTLMTRIGSRLYGINDPIPQRAVRPFISVEPGNEVDFNTLGATNTAKWGNRTTINVRIVSGFRANSEIIELRDLVKQTVVGQPITVAGFPSASIAWPEGGHQMIEDFSSGTLVQECLIPLDLLTHQGAR